MKYRKNSVIIDAARYMIDKSLPDWFMDKVTDNTIITHKDGTCHIKTLEGTMKADHGDYIILGVSGEVYPCKPDIFEKTYDKVNEIKEKEINIMRFKIGDYVETNDGKVGYISHICYCDKCRKHEFFEPTIKYTDGSEDYISNYAASNIKNEYKRIGKYSFETKGWSEWKLTPSGERSKDGRNIIIHVRENGKKVQVRGSGYRAEAACCNGDRFDLNKGLELARLRWIAKWHQGKAEEYAKSL